MASETKVPKCFKPFANIIGFTFFTCIYTLFSGFFSSYTVSQLTNIGKQFNMGTDRISSLTLSSEIGFIIATLFTGHFFSRLHRPRILFVMGCINSLACCMAAFPYILDLSFNPNSLGYYTSGDKGVCDAYRVVVSKKPSSANYAFLSDYSSGLGWNDLFYGIFIVAAFLAGIATSGVWTIGVTYVDDNSDPKKSSMYLGIIFFIRLLSPVGALLLGSCFSALPLHLRVTQHTKPIPGPGYSIREYVYGWVGAWWLGYVILGVINVIVGIPLLFFPKHMSMSENVTSATVDVTMSQEDITASDDEVITIDGDPTFCQLLKEFPRVIGRLLCNPVLMFMIFGLTLEVAISASYTFSIPLYFEFYFHVSAYTANLIMRFTVAAAAALGVLIGGCATTFIRLSLNKLAAIAAVSDLSATLLFLVIFLINCDSGKMAGFNTPPGARNWSQPCNVNCNCDDTVFNPVCGSDGVSYPSPCHAGCPDMNLGLYPNCTCVESGLGSAVAGQCVSSCDQSLMAYGVLLFIVAVVLSAATIPAYMIHLRCVRKEDKSVAIGLSNMISSIVLLLLPILFGTIIDKACLIYPNSSRTRDPHCSFYDNEQLKYRLHLTAFVGKLFPPLLYCLGLFAARNLTFAGDAQSQVEDEHKDRKVEGVDLVTTTL